MATLPEPPHNVANRNRRVGLYVSLVALAMLGLGYASVPLYRLFCQATGFNGTTQRASEAQAAKVSVSKGTMSIRFDANVERGLEWDFRPLKITDTVNIGARKVAIFLAKNNSDRPITGRASYNVEPEEVGKYFDKIQCFCFTEQTLQPHQEVRMPVIYYVDPAIQQDPDAKSVQQITLSYTFHEDRSAEAKPLDRSATAR
jgi:cytochrome c oxidase assembly protein subunit 11